MGDFISTTDAIAAKRGKKPTPKRVAGIVIGVIVGAALCIGIGFGALGLLNDTLGKKHQAPIALSEQTVLTSLNAERLAPPDLSGYAHLSTDNARPALRQPLHRGNRRRRRIGPASRRHGGRHVRQQLPDHQRPAHRALRLRRGRTSSGSCPSKAWSPFRQAAARPAVASIEAASSSCSQATTPRSGATFANAGMLTRASFTETGGTADVQLTKRSEDGRTVTTCTVAIKVTWADGRAGRPPSYRRASPSRPRRTRRPRRSRATGRHRRAVGVIEANGTSTILENRLPVLVSLGGAQGVPAERFNLVTTNPNLSVAVGSHVTIRGTITSISSMAGVPFEIDVTAV